MKIEKDIDDFLTKALTIKNQTSINVNDGDVVWDGRNAIVVAIS